MWVGIFIAMFNRSRRSDIHNFRQRFLEERRVSGMAIAAAMAMLLRDGSEDGRLEFSHWSEKFRQYQRRRQTSRRLVWRPSSRF